MGIATSRVRSVQAESQTDGYDYRDDDAGRSSESAKREENVLHHSKRRLGLWTIANEGGFYSVTHCYSWGELIKTASVDMIR